MYYTDFHIHSTISTDASDTMPDMARAAAERGIDCLCFTDHYDLDQHATGEPDPDWFAPWPRSVECWRETCEQLPGLDIRLGMELGEANHRPEEAAAAVSEAQLDFVLGSTHNLLNTLDFYDLSYESEEQCRELNIRYLAELIETARLPFIDCIGHIGYTRRYMYRDGFSAHLNLSEHGDGLRELLRTVIESGKAIEINCSGLRREALRLPIPDTDILRLYRELGGELITVGSDGHRVRDAGFPCAEGYEILRLLGYRYVTAYKDRRPEMIKL